MLHPQDWQSGEKSHHSLSVVLIAFSIIVATFYSCLGGKSDEEQARERAEKRALNVRLIDEHLEYFFVHDTDSLEADRQLRDYYRNRTGSYVWLNEELLTDHRADTLVLILRKELKRMGFSSQPFFLDELSSLLDSVRTISPDSLDERHTEHLATLEYLLSKSFLRYSMGQRHGFVKLKRLMNRLDRDEDDTLRITFKRIYDLPETLPADNEASEALKHVATNRMEGYLEASLPDDSLYRLLAEKLPLSKGDDRLRLMANMERLRHRTPDRRSSAGRRVIVNVASQQLYAFGPDTTFIMRVVCGTRKTKTPLLSSAISYLQVNPEWTIPTSIVKKEVSHHAGDSAYFARNRYKITNKADGGFVEPRTITRQQLMSGKYRVAQESGPGNSLGRLIFRFPNDFSVYLHDTSNPSAFQRDVRLLSHGCVRVQRPYDLALFLMDTSDEWLIDRLRMSIDLHPLTNRGKAYEKDHADDKRPWHLIRSYSFTPHVPVHIIYYTLYQHPQTGELIVADDVYGYDKAINSALSKWRQ